MPGICGGRPAHRPVPTRTCLRFYCRLSPTSDIPDVTCFGCTRFGSPVFALLSRAAAKSAGARLRRAGILRTDPLSAGRLQQCEACSLRVVADGVAHCGKPLLKQIRRPADQGCGCPVEDKARRPGEHCPITLSGRPRNERGICDCKWCERIENAVRQTHGS